MREAGTGEGDPTRALTRRAWVSDVSEELAAEVSERTARSSGGEVLAELGRLVALNHTIHDVEALNLNPATNVMNPRAEAMLSAGLGSRASLGHPGEKYETGLEAIERIEVVASELLAEVFDATYAEVRVPSASIANLYAFIATCEPGQTIIAPPPEIGGHVTHHRDGSAGQYRLTTVPAPVDADRYTVDVDELRALAHDVRPALITIGSSLNLTHHPVAAIREVADEVGAKVMFDAAHLCGVIAGGAWPNPLDEGAHLMTFSTYKSLGGPPGGAIVTRDADLAERLDAIAFPGLTANSDPGRAAALAVTLVDWREAGKAYADRMVALAQRLASELAARGVALFETAHGPTRSHQLAVLAHPWGGGQAAARLLREANLLACGIGLPIEPVAGDLNGLRLGTPELARLGMRPDDMVELAHLLARALVVDGDPAAVAREVTAYRSRFSGVHFTADRPT